MNEVGPEAMNHEWGRRLQGVPTATDGSEVTFEPEFDGAETFKVVGSLASILGCFFIVVTFLLFPPLRRYHTNLVLWVAVTGMVYHGSVIAQPQRIGARCASAPITQAALIAQECFCFVVAFNFYYTTKHPFMSTKFLVPFYHLFVWVVSFVSAYVASKNAEGVVYSLGFCWFATPDAHTRNTLLITFALPILLGYVVSIGWYVVATKRLRRGVGTKRIKRTTLDTVRNYLVWSFVYWMVLLAVYFLRREGAFPTNSPEEKVVRFVGRMMLALKGLLTAVLWAHVLGMKNAYGLWKKGNWDEYMRVHEATWVLRRQILYFATKGIKYSASLAVGTHVDSTGLSNSFFTQLSGLNPWNVRRDTGQDEGPTVIPYELHGTHRSTGEQKATFRDFHPASFQEIRRLSGISNESYAHSFSGRTKERFSEGKSGSFLYYTGDQLFILKTCTPGEQRYLLTILPQYIAHLRKNPNSYLCRYVGCHELVMEHHTVCFIVLTNILTNTTLNVDEFYDLKGSWVGRFQGHASNGTRRVCKYCGRDFIVGMTKEPCPRNTAHSGRGHAELVVGKDANWGGRRLRLPNELAKQLGTQLYADSEFLRLINSMDYSLIIGMSRCPTFSLASEEDGGIRSLQVIPPSRGGDNGIGYSGESGSSGVYRDQGDSAQDKQVGDSKSQSLSRSQSFSLLEEDPDETPFYDTTYAEAASPVASRTFDSFPSEACVVSMGIIDILTPWSLRKTIEHMLRVYFQCRDQSGISCVNPTKYAERFRKNVIDVVIFGQGSPFKRQRQQRQVRRREREDQSKELIMVDFAHSTPVTI